jgi:serine/threonine protein kinase
MSICINPHCSNPENKDTLLFCQSCESELLIDGRYRVISPLGKGGFGKTYEVIDCTLQPVGNSSDNLKVLKVLIHNHPKYVELFQREARCLAQLNHPGIPRVEPDAYFTFYPHHSRDPLHCLVMEKIEGLDLKRYITRRETGISQKRAIQWLIQIIEILREIHSQNFFHRDIKPSNIMLRANGQMVLIDFGTVREVTQTYVSKQSSNEITRLFSAGYTAPEQLHGQAMPQSDFFALGRTFLYLLTGQEPSQFYNSEQDRLEWQSAIPDLHPQFADLLERLMASNLNQRPPSAAIILEELSEIYQSLYGSYLSSRLPPSTPLESAQSTDSQPVSPGISIPSTVDINPPSQSSATPPPANQLSLTPDFVARCQQELAQWIGPMASIICQRTVSKNSQLSPEQFVRALAKNIPEPQEAEKFSRNLMSSF